jgi:hypothetical protein
MEKFLESTGKLWPKSFKKETTVTMVLTGLNLPLEMEGDLSLVPINFLRSVKSLERESEILRRASKIKRRLTSHQKNGRDWRKKQRVKGHFVSFIKESYKGKKFYPKDKNLLSVLYNSLDLSL